MAAVKALQQWCRLQCQGYRDVSITNMTTSFRDGLAFCALIHKHRPELINFDSLKKEDVFENNKLAFKVAEEQLGIPALLDAEDMVALKVPDRLSILTYVSQYYNYFHGRSPIGGMGGIKRPAEDPKDEVSGKKNLPVNSKVYHSPHPARENSPPLSSDSQRPPAAPQQAKSARQDVLVERTNQTGTLNNKCAACHKHVHLVQRHLVDRKLYHRSCAKSLTPTNTGALFRDLPTTEVTASPRSPRAGDSHPPPHDSARLRPTWLAERASGSSSAVSPPPPVSSLPPAAAKHTVTITAPNTAPRTASQAVTPTPTPAPRTSTTAAKTLQSKLKFFESDGSASEKTAESSSDDANGGPGKIQPAVPVVLREETTTSPNTERNKSTAVAGSSKVGENSKTKGAAAFISSKLAERSENSSKPDIKKADVTPSPAGVRSRVRLKADLSLLADPQSLDVPSPASRARAPSPLPEPSKPFTTSAPESESPAGWRSKLKPTSRDAKLSHRPAAPSPSSRPRWAEKDRQTWQISSPSAPGPSASLTPAPEGSLNGQEENRENGTKSKTAKPKTEDYICREDILTELQDIEDNLNEWEKRGVELEVRLRTCEEEGEDDGLMDELMVEWFNLIRNKQVAMRRESELVYIGRSQELEEQQPSVEQELRRLMEKPEHLKTARQKKREEELMAKLVEIVNDRNAIVEGLDEDRIREEEEDEQLNAMMKNFNNKKDKSKKKSPMSKLFRWGGKKED